MVKKVKYRYIIVLVLLTLLTAVAFTKARVNQQNNPPLVKIINPKNNGTVTAGDQVSYEISVADKEDGDSKYDEINVKEVLLEVKYVDNRARLQAVIKNEAGNDPAGLMLLRSSNCFTCHNFNSKAMGPSFYDIAVKYTATPSNTEVLVKHIREGSVNVWGKDPMPAHPELSAEQTTAVVNWILKTGKDATVDYYAGTTGVFHTRPNAKGAYVLIASYLDHGLKNGESKSLKGTDVIVLNGSK